MAQGIVGRIIGRGGETIRALQQASEAHIVVNQNFPDGEPRQVNISGRPEAVERAVNMVQELISGEPGSAQAIIQKVSPSRGVPERAAVRLINIVLTAQRSIQLVIGPSAQRCPVHATQQCACCPEASGLCVVACSAGWRCCQCARECAVGCSHLLITRAHMDQLPLANIPE